jgi:hypothetical protein
MSVTVKRVQHHVLRRDIWLNGHLLIVAAMMQKQCIGLRPRKSGDHSIGLLPLFLGCAAQKAAGISSHRQK